MQGMIFAFGFIIIYGINQLHGIAVLTDYVKIILWRGGGWAGNRYVT